MGPTAPAAACLLGLCLHVLWVHLSMLQDPGLPASQSLEWTRKVSTFLQWTARKALLSPPLGSDIRVVRRPFRNTPYTMAVVQGACSILKKSVCLLTGCHVQMGASAASLRSHSSASGMYSCVYLHTDIFIHLHTMHYTKYIFILYCVSYIK